MKKRCIIFVAGALLLVGCGSGDQDDTTNAADSAAWRVLVDDHQVGGPIDAGIRTATDADTFDELWALLGREGNQPAIAFDDEVVIAYAMSYPSGCEFPFIGLVIDEPNAVIAANYAGNEPAVCAADENQYLVMIGINRDALTNPPYQLITSVGGSTDTLDL